MAKHDQTLDSLFQALADPTRRAVLQRLSQGPATVSELAEPFRMALPTFLQHLRKLEAGGLIETSKAGRVRTCTMTPAALSPAQDWISEQRRSWEDRFDRLEAYIATLPDAEGRDD